MSHVPFLGNLLALYCASHGFVFSILYVPLITECGGDSPPHPQPSRAEQPTDVAVPIGAVLSLLSSSALLSLLVLVLTPGLAGETG